MLKLTGPLTIPRLLGLGALGAGAGIAAGFLLVLYLTRPESSSGMDATSRLVTWIALGGVIVALVAVHVVLGLQLLSDDATPADRSTTRV